MPFCSYRSSKEHLLAQCTEFKGLILFPFIWKQEENLTESSIIKWSEQY